MPGLRPPRCYLWASYSALRKEPTFAVLMREAVRGAAHAQGWSSYQLRSGDTQHYQVAVGRRAAGGPRAAQVGPSEYHADLHAEVPGALPFPCPLQEDDTVVDDLKDRGAQDRSRVNVNEKHEVRYWTKKWGVTKEQLMAAIQRVGVSVRAVAKELGKE
jgi:hypothetical protein